MPSRRSINRVVAELWCSASTERCSHCLQRYIVELEQRCVHCDGPLCPLCVTAVRGEARCPACPDDAAAEEA